MLRKVMRSAGWARRVATALWFMALGGFLLLDPKRRGGASGVLLGLLLSVVRYCVFWAIVWLLIWLVRPTVLAGSRAGLQTALQVLPATIVALLVLVLGSLFVIVQVLIQLWGTRSPVMIGLDEQVHLLVARPLIIVAVTLSLAGQVPDSGSPDDAVLAAVATLAVATIRVFYTAAFAMPTLAQRYTLPRGFPRYVIEDVEDQFQSGDLGLVVFRVPLLSEMLKLALRRGDSVAVMSVLEASTDFHRHYLIAIARNPDLRRFTTEDGTVRARWFADDLITGLVRGAEDALGVGAPGEDLNAIARTASGFAAHSLHARELEDAKRAINGLTEMGTSAHQVALGFVNHYSEPVGQLAYLEAQAEEVGELEVAAQALAAWFLLIAYASFHHRFDTPHPLLLRSIRAFGPVPPWDDALRLLFDDEWTRKWANKQYYGPELVAIWVPMVQAGFAVRDDNPALEEWYGSLREFASILVHGEPSSQEVEPDGG